MSRTRLEEGERLPGNRLKVESNPKQTEEHYSKAEATNDTETWYSY